MSNEDTCALCRGMGCGVLVGRQRHPVHSSDRCPPVLPVGKPSLGNVISGAQKSDMHYVVFKNSFVHGNILYAVIYISCISVGKVGKGTTLLVLYNVSENKHF